MIHRILGALAAFTFVLVTLPTDALAQGTLAGDWDVLVVATGQTIPIVLHITEGDDGFGGTVDAPSQGGIDKPLTSVTVDHPEFRLEFETGGPPVIFEGARKAEAESGSAEGEGSW